MNTAPGTAMSVHSHPSFFEKASSWAAWALAGAVFLTVGWMAMAPDDPLGAVSLLTRRHPMLMLVQAGGLAAITAALATVVVGRRLPHAGTFAAGVGLTAVSLRGGTTSHLLLLNADGSPDFQSALAVKFASEAAQWFVVLLIAVGTSAVVTRWCHSSSLNENSPPEVESGQDAIAGYRRPSKGWRHFVTTLAAGFFAYQILSGGWAARSIQHGQACFVVAATIGVAAYLAYRISPVRSPVPSILAAGVLAVLGYLWASFRSAPAGLPAGIPVSPFLRVLPLQFVAVGAAAAVAMNWYMLPSTHEVDLPNEDPTRDPGP